MWQWMHVNLMKRVPPPLRDGLSRREERTLRSLESSSASLSLREDFLDFLSLSSLDLSSFLVVDDDDVDFFEVEDFSFDFVEISLDFLPSFFSLFSASVSLDDFSALFPSSSSPLAAADSSSPSTCSLSSACDFFSSASFSLSSSSSSWSPSSPSFAFDVLSSSASSSSSSSSSLAFSDVFERFDLRRFSFLSSLPSLSSSLFSSSSSSSSLAFCLDFFLSSPSSSLEPEPPDFLALLDERRGLFEERLSKRRRRSELRFYSQSLFRGNRRNVIYNQGVGKIYMYIGMYVYLNLNFVCSISMICLWLDYQKKYRRNSNIKKCIFVFSIIARDQLLSSSSSLKWAFDCRQPYLWIMGNSLQEFNFDRFLFLLSSLSCCGRGICFFYIKHIPLMLFEKSSSISFRY